MSEDEAAKTREKIRLDIRTAQAHLAQASEGAQEVEDNLFHVLTADERAQLGAAIQKLSRIYWSLDLRLRSGAEVDPEREP